MATVVAGGQRGVSRVLTKLDSSIESGNYYEAHQMYRTLYFRYTAQQKFDECLELLYNGSMKLMEKLQDTSAADLGLLLVDTLEKREKRSSTDDVLWIGRLGVIIGRLSATTVERETLINRSVKWSGEVSGNSLGHPIMHKLIAQIFWAEGNTEQARHHYLLCRDGKLCGRILIKISRSKGYTSEIDLFIVQAVLQQLCLKDNKTAKDTFISYTVNHPLVKKAAPFKQPLLNFTWFLLKSIELGRLDAFHALREFYKPSLNRDPSFDKYLVKIGVLFFNITPPAPTVGGGLMGGMFGDLFSRLFQGFDDDEELQEHSGSGGDDAHSNELD